MDGNNWRGGCQVQMFQPQAGTVEQIALSSSGGAPPMDPDGWRAQLPLDSRQRIVDKIMESLKKHLPFSGQEGLEELKKIAVRFEEKIYSAATSQSDYLRKVSLKILTWETKPQSPMAANSLQPGAANASRNPSDLGSLNIVLPPSTPVAPSPVHAELEKVNASLSSHLDTEIGHIQAPNAAGSSALPVAISITNTNTGHLEAPNAAGSSVLPLSIYIGESEIVNARLSSQPNTHIIHLEAPNPAGSSAKPLAISITITIA